MADKRDPSVTLALQVMLSLGIWFASIVVVTLVLNRHPASPILRGAMVALGVFGFATWIRATGKAIFAQDEFTQRLHLIALASAFAAPGIIVFAADFLQRAGFLDYLSLTTIWVLMFASWWVSVMIASRLYR